MEIVKTFEAQQVTAERLTEASMHEAYKDKVAKETEAVRNQVKASMEATIALEKKEKEILQRKLKASQMCDTTVQTDPISQLFSAAHASARDVDLLHTGLRAHTHTKIRLPKA